DQSVVRTRPFGLRKKRNLTGGSTATVIWRSAKSGPGRTSAAGAMSNGRSTRRRTCAPLPPTMVTHSQVIINCATTRRAELRLLTLDCYRDLSDAVLAARY